MLFLTLLMIGLFVSGVLIIFLNRGGKTSQKIRQARQMKFYRRLYRFFSNFFVTQGYLASIYRKIANLSIYRKEEIQVLAVKYLLVSWGGGLALIVLSFLLFKDFLTVLLCIFLSIFFTTILVDKQLDKVNFRVMKAFSLYLSSVRQEYLKSNSVVEALNDADCPTIIKKPMEEIAQILISTNAELKLQEFCDATPYRLIQTFAILCYHINNQGDDVDPNGHSNFVQSLMTLTSDVNSEIEKITYRKKKFGVIEYLTLFPLVGIGLLESYFTSIMPGTALIYNGPLGYVSRVLIVLSMLVSYTIISRVNTTNPIKEDDRNLYIESWLQIPRIRKFIKNITPKNEKRRKVENLLKSALSRMSIEHFYLKKVLYGVALFVLTILIAISAINLGRDFIWTSTQQLSLIPSNTLSKYPKETIRKLDETYLRNAENFNDKQIQSMVREYLPGLTDLEVQDQVKRLKDKYRSLKGLHFYWWYIWIAAGVGVFGWFVPNIALRVRKIMIQTEEEEEFLQLQALVAVLMNTNIDTLDLLFYLSQYSRIYKDMFLYAYQGYASDPELELTRLQAKTPILEFKRFIGKLKLSISELSLKEVYSDLYAEREHILRMRDMSIRSSIDKKRTYCGFLSMVPLGLLVLGEFLIPLGVLGYNEFTNILQTI